MTVSHLPQGERAPETDEALYKRRASRLGVTKPEVATKVVAHPTTLRAGTGTAAPSATLPDLSRLNLTSIPPRGHARFELVSPKLKLDSKDAPTTWVDARTGGLSIS